MNNTASLTVIKHILFSFLLLFFYVLQSVPGLFVFYGVKPLWVIPAAVVIAMMEGEFVGGIYGALAGLLCDTSGFLLFGFNGFISALCCIMAGLLVVFLMRCNLLSCILFVFVTMLLRGSIEYFFSYGMWNYPGSWMIYTRSTLPTVALSTLATVPIFWIVRLIHRRFAYFEEGTL